MILNGAVANVVAVPVSTGRRVAIDRNANGILDGDERLPQITLQLQSAAVAFAWSPTGPEAVLEWTPSLAPATWFPVLDVRTITNGVVSGTHAPNGPTGFYRLRKP
jgi:hypothetical protein